MKCKLSYSDNVRIFRGFKPLADYWYLRQNRPYLLPSERAQKVFQILSQKGETTCVNM